MPLLPVITAALALSPRCPAPLVVVDGQTLLASIIFATI